MSAVIEATRFDLVDEGRGARIRERRERLGIKRAPFAARVPVDRGRLGEVEDGTAENVSEEYYKRIERALDELEQEMGMNDAPQGRVIGDPSDDLIEFSVEGNFGVRAVVKGPVRDMDVMQAAVAKLVRDMQNNDSANP